MTLDQGGHAVIGSDNNKKPGLVVIKRIKKLDKSFTNRIRPFTSEHLVQIKNMYEDDDDVVIVYETMDVTLRPLTGIRPGPLKAFQIAAICKEVGRLFFPVAWRRVLTILKQLLEGLSYLHKELDLYHGALSCGTILLNLDGRVKIGEFLREESGYY